MNLEEKIAKLDNKQPKPKKKKAKPPKAASKKPKDPQKKQHPQKQGNQKKKQKPSENKPQSSKKHSSGKKQQKAPAKKTALRVIPLGGLDEIGKNLTAIEYGDDIIIIDCGMAFPDADMLGVDHVIPDFTYLFKNSTKIRGVFVTHGHEDHIGALPYFLREIKVPVYANKLTIGLIRRKLSEHKLDKQAILMECKPGDVVKRGCFSVEFIKVNHSIADSAAFAIRTPVGTIVHMGDFKIDTTPIRGRMIDLTRLGTLGHEGVLLLMSDSTNAERPGIALSERTVGVSFENIFARAIDKRIFIATFSSNVHRVQQIIKTAVKYGRKVAISGRSMEGVITVAHELGYIDIPKGTLVPIERASNFPKGEIVVITTGSQGEPMSALYRMAFSDHRTISIDKDDLVVISATPIPGNEKLVSTVVNELEKLGAEVIADRSAGVHVSGHACQEELKLILGLVKPKFFMPVHGEFRHLLAHKRLAVDSGMDEQNVFINEIGGVLSLTENSAKITESVPSGQLMIDGGSIGDVGNIVLRDRQLLAEDGMIVVVAAVSAKAKSIISGPDIISRGFVYMRDSEELIAGAKDAAMLALSRNIQRDVFDWSTLKGDVGDSVRKYIVSKTKRTPIIIPIIMEV
ncbi:MAG: ribonuclease J [Clostridia bacterium]|nr:ribonuclease J [Clostridia bacterium]